MTTHLGAWEAVAVLFIALDIAAVGLAVVAHRRTTPLWPPHSPVADAAIVMTAAVATAAAGLVIEDWLPGPRVPDTTGVTSLARIVVAAQALVVLGALVHERQRMRRLYGTLYYIRALQGIGGDRHHSSLLREAKWHLKTRFINVIGGTPNSEDAVDYVKAIVGDFTAQLNADSNDSGFSLAPNCLVDIGLSLGSLTVRETHALAPSDVLMVEFDATIPHRWTFPANLDNRTDPSPFTVAHFPLGGQTDLPTLTAAVVLATPGLAGSGPIMTMPTDLRIGSCWVAASNPALEEQGFTGWGVAMGDGKRGTANPQDMTLAALEALARAVHDNDGAPTPVFLRLPKTVAVAVGAHLELATKPLCALVGMSDCRQASCTDPWSVLIPMRWHAGERRWHSVRVNDAQPGTWGSVFDDYLADTL